MGLPAAGRCRQIFGLPFFLVFAEAPGESSTVVGNEELFCVLVEVLIGH